MSMNASLASSVSLCSVFDVAMSDARVESLWQPHIYHVGIT